jgi:hypothetical protein
MECLLSFSAGFFVFQFAIQKFIDEDLQNYNSAGCFICVQNLFAHNEGGK